MTRAPALGRGPHHLAPLGRAGEIANRLARRDHVAERPAQRDRQLQLLAGRDRGRLVEPPHALRHTRLPDQGETLERQADRLQVRHRALPPEPRRRAREADHLLQVASHTQLERALDHGQPAVIGAAREGIEQAVRALQPAAGDGVVAPELEMVGGQPGRDTTRPQHVTAPAVGLIGVLARAHGQRSVVKPVAGPAEPFPCLTRALVLHRFLEALAGLGPGTASERVSPLGEAVGDGVRVRGHPGFASQH